MADGGNGAFTVSVCIPTYNRPDLLLLAIESCLAQTVLPDEILIGDDSTDDSTRGRVESFIADTRPDVRIRFVRNSPALRQSANVRMLFAEAAGEKVVLLHDDDLLLPAAVERMKAAFAAHDIDAAFGKQYLIDEAGAVDLRASEQASRFYFKTGRFVDNVLAPIDVALSHQFPNDAYMVDADLARRVGYPDESAGDACDFVFAFDLGRAGCRFFLIDEYLASYRDTAVSISSAGGDASYVIYNTVKDFPYAPVDLDFKTLLLQRHVRQAIMRAIEQKRRREALGMYVGRYHRRFIPTPGGMRRLLRLVRG